MNGGDEAAVLAALQGDHRAESTGAAYAYDWKHFYAWCVGEQRNPLPATPETIVHYLAASIAQGRSRQTVYRSLSGIAARHRGVDAGDPTMSASVRHARANLHRVGARGERAKPIDVESLRAALPQGTETGEIRDKAILLVGFGAGLRRSEVAALNIGDIEVADEGLMVMIRRSKTDKRGAGEIVGIHRGAHNGSDPVEAFLAWKAAREKIVEMDEMALFVNIVGKRISDRSVYSVVRRRLGDEYGAHGALRAGFVTAAAKTGADAVRISFTSRHASLAVLRGYIRPATVFSQAIHLGL